MAHLFDEAVIHCAYLDPNGLIGYDQAAYWDKGEWHESGIETGMILIIVEGVNVDPAKRMPPV